ncbi:unnamed protein product [Paramecium sonneborni]|uniref:Uncharacterized protein n=1 Tax=Paramecium sonneborni TaxID=65129 RepID=A0A8S1R7N8_9CILI|nr:unnamed protein product [Paramecium sonneborni]
MIIYQIKQIIVSKYDKQVNFLRKTEKDEFKVKYSLPFNTTSLCSQLSEDGEYFIIWDISLKKVETTEE